MSEPNFDFAFWHSFGPHSGEAASAILDRKSAEVARNGWTLWSFRYRPMLNDWHRLFVTAQPQKIVVFCSAGSGRDPKDRGGDAQVADCRSYQLLGEQEWRSIPPAIRVPHTFPRGVGVASAFVVREVSGPETIELSPVEWLAQGAKWREGCKTKSGRTLALPTLARDLLIRPGGSTGLVRRVAAVLELQAPYLAVVRSEEAEPLS